jgi:hypothetical protein
MNHRDIIMSDPMISISKNRMRVLIISKYSKQQCNVHSISNYISKIFIDDENELTKQQFYKVMH